MLRARRAAVIGALLAAASFTSSRPAAACTCTSGGPTCQVYWSSPLVVDAVAHSIDGGYVTLDVLHVWKGTVRSNLVVQNGNSSTCTFEFQVGVRYLVFAGQDFANVRARVSSCGGTHAWNGSGPDAEFLASLSRPGSGGRVTGTVSHFTAGGGGVPESGPRAVDVPVHLTAPTTTSTVTSKHGDYLFTGLAPGRYQLSINPPASFVAYPASIEVDIPDAHACAWQSFSVRDNGRIAGRVLIDDGPPPEGFRLELVTAAVLSRLEGVSPRNALPKADGSFEFGGLPPGDYVIAVNLRDGVDRANPYSRTVYSTEGSAAHVFSIKAGERVDLGSWRLPPPVPAVAVSGVVTWEDGKPAAGVRVFALDRQDVFPNAAATALSNADGRFDMQLWQRRTYRFRVEFEDSEPIFVAAPTLTTAAEPPAPVRIVMRRAPR